MGAATLLWGRPRGAVARSMPITAFSQWLTGIMDERALSLRQVASYAHVSPSTVKQWLDGTQPRRESVDKLAAGLHVDPDDVWRIVGSGTNVSGSETMAVYQDETMAEIESWVRQGQQLLERYRQRRQPPPIEGAS